MIDNKISFSQNNEDNFVIQYFEQVEDLKPSDLTILSIGENDGKTFSNSYKMIALGAKADLIEPIHDCWKKIMALHASNPSVAVHPIAIGLESGEATIYKSDTILKQGDVGLVSSMKLEETSKWRKNGVMFAEEKIMVCTFSHFYEKLAKYKKYDFISIDVEGLDYEVLSQIDLNEVGCKAICIEFNSNEELLKKITSYCAKFNFTHVVTAGQENVLLFKD